MSDNKFLRKTTRKSSAQIIRSQLQQNRHLSQVSEGRCSGPISEATDLVPIVAKTRGSAVKQLNRIGINRVWKTETLQARVGIWIATFRFRYRRCNLESWPPIPHRSIFWPSKSRRATRQRLSHRPASRRKSPAPCPRMPCR